VGAALPLEDRVGAVALHREGHFLEAAAVVGARRQGLGLVAAALGVPGEHPVQVTRPERGLVAAGGLPDLDEHVLRVGRVGLDECELQLLFERAQTLLELRDELPQVAVAAGGIEIVADLAPLLGEPVRGLELLQAPADLRRLAVVVVDGRVGHALLGLPVGALDLLDELLNGHGIKVSAASSGSS
jgi:hypothetical protein